MCLNAAGNDAAAICKISLLAHSCPLTCTTARPQLAKADTAFRGASVGQPTEPCLASAGGGFSGSEADGRDLLHIACAWKALREGHEEDRRPQGALNVQTPARDAPPRLRNGAQARLPARSALPPQKVCGGLPAPVSAGLSENGPGNVKAS